MKPAFLKQFSASDFQQDKLTASHLGSNIFRDIRGGFINEFYLFEKHFGTIANFVEEKQINCPKANEWFFQNYQDELVAYHFSQLYYSSTGRTDFDDIYYVLNHEMVIYFEAFNSIVRILFSHSATARVNELKTSLQQFRKKRDRMKPQLSLLAFKNGELDTIPVEITKPRLKIQDNYNDDFGAIHHIIYKRLNRKNDKGLVLLHGKPGTGKTSYIRYLVASLKKQVIFLPPNIAEVITNPAFMTLLVERPNTVLVIEDAETIIMDRQHGGRSSVSTLLNLADGLLSDCLNIQIICSFNTDISRIDNALLRRGRLIAQYEFKALETQKAQALSDKLGFTGTIKQPTNLADIYNQEEKEFLQKRKEVIGFVSRGNPEVVEP